MNFLLNYFGFAAYLIVAISSLFVLFVLNSLSINKKILLDKISYSNHKSYINTENVPLTGGMLLILSVILLAYFDNPQNTLIVSLMFLIGFMSDFQIINSTKKRFILQIFVIILFLINNDFVLIDQIRLKFVDNLLQKNELISIIFTSFCLLILINGSNFIDGTNLQCSGYYLSILITLLFLSFENFFVTDLSQINIILISLFVFIIFNFFNKSFLGDGGTYLISFLIGIILIEFFLRNSVSPYFIALLLWYPAFENLFSIIRRIFLTKKDIDEPDNLHLHHLIYLKFSKKIKNKILKNNITGLTIFIFNLIIFKISTYYIFDSLIQISLILFSISIYCFVYLKLKNNNKK